MSHFFENSSKVREKVANIVIYFKNILSFEHVSVNSWQGHQAVICNWFLE